MKEKDDKILIAQIDDKITMCENKNKIEYTDFLDLAQIELVQNYIEKLKIENYISYGGFDQAERKMFVIYPERFNSTVVEKNLSNIVKIVRIQLPEDLKGKYTHRDYLGGLIKLGIKREKIGDILVFEDGADILILEEISKFVITNITQLTRFSKSKIEVVNLEDVREKKINKKEINLIVSSMRLDCIVSEIAKTSRGKAEEIINDARVFVNYENIMKSTKQIKEKDIITIRRIGKFKLEKIDGKTRNERVKIIVSQYI